MTTHHTTSTGVLDSDDIPKAQVQTYRSAPGLPRGCLELSARRKRRGTRTSEPDSFIPAIPAYGPRLDVLGLNSVTCDPNFAAWVDHHPPSLLSDFSRVSGKGVTSWMRPGLQKHYEQHVGEQVSTQ